MSGRYIIPSLDRAVQVLGLIAQTPKGLSLAELVRLTDVPKSTLFRILTTLQHHHFVQWNETERSFQLGYYLWELGSGYLDRHEPHRIAERHMRKLSEATGETVFLAKLESNLVVFLRRVDGTNTVALMQNLSQSVPAYCTASGRALLAYLPDDEVDTILDEQEMVKHTSRTVTGRDALKASLLQVREEGFAMVDSEYNKDLLYLSAPIFDHTGRVQAALTIVTLSHEQDPQLLDKYAVLIKESASACSREMGYLEKGPLAYSPGNGNPVRPKKPRA